MEHRDQSYQPHAAEAGWPEGQATTLPGGYQSRGVPGEEGEVRNRMRVLKVGDRSQRINSSRPLTGSTGAEDASAARLDKGEKEARWAAGARLAARGDTEVSTVFVIVKKGGDFLDTPVFHADEEAVALFTNRPVVGGSRAGRHPLRDRQPGPGTAPRR